jgi:hypothetical protein
MSARISAGKQKPDARRLPGKTANAKGQGTVLTTDTSGGHLKKEFKIPRNMGFSFEPLRARPDVWLRTPQVLKPIPARKPRSFPEVGLSLSDASNPLLPSNARRVLSFLPKENPAGVTRVGSEQLARFLRC